jgi:hypothetical protein
MDAGAAYARLLERPGIPQELEAQALQGLDTMLRAHQQVSISIGIST